MKNLMVFDTNLNLKGFVMEYGDFKFQEVLSDVGSFSFYVPLTEANKELLTIHSIVNIMSRVSGIITSRSLYLDENKIAVSGKTLNTLLERRCILQTAYAPSMLKEIPVSPATSFEEQVTLYMRNTPAWDSATSRWLKNYNFYVEASGLSPESIHGTDVITKGEGESILDFCKAYKTITDVDFNVYADLTAKQYKFELIDRRPSDTIVTDPEFIGHRVYTESIEGLCNYVTEYGEYFADTTTPGEYGGVQGEALSADGTSGMERIVQFFTPRKKTQDYIRSANRSRINFDYHTCSYNASLEQDFASAKNAHDKEAQQLLHSGKKSYEFTLNVDKDYVLGDVIKIQDKDLGRSFSFLIVGIDYVLTGDTFSKIYTVESSIKGADAIIDHRHPVYTSSYEAGPWEVIEPDMPDVEYEWRKRLNPDESGKWRMLSTEYFIFTNVKSLDLVIKTDPAATASTYYTCTYNVDELESVIRPGDMTSENCKGRTNASSNPITLHYTFPKDGEPHVIAVKAISDTGFFMQSGHRVGVKNIETW